MDDRTRNEARGGGEAPDDGDAAGADSPPTPPHRGASRLVTWLLAPAALTVLILFQAHLFREATCETYDEFTYLRMGICVYRQGDFRSLASPMCPPLPILLEYWLPALQADSLPDTAGWESEVPALTRQARLLTTVLVGVPLVWLIYGWLARRRGWVFGVVGGGMVAMSPTVLAAASIATTDACFALFAVVALAAIHHYQLRPSRRSFLAAGAAMGLALASKHSAVLLFPVALLELSLNSPARGPGSTRVDHCLWVLFRAGTRLAAMVALAFLVDWALYGFGLAPKIGVPGSHAAIPVIVPMVANLFPNGESIMAVVKRSSFPLAIDTFVGQLDHALDGHPAFLMGRHSSQGWWYFFPVAIALKSTPAELVMISVVVLMATRPRTWRDPARRLWVGSILTLLGLGICSSLNIGHRYMLLIYPLAALLAVDRIGEAATRRPVRMVAVGVLFLAWQAVSAVGIAPHYLGYFNTLCGGPSEGYRYLVDSSLDWGQDLPSLRRELEARGYHKVALCYFGTAKPSTYGLRSEDWMSCAEPDAADCDWLAVSATAMQGVYGGSSDLWKRFAVLPVVRAGYSIFLYDLKDPRVRAALDAVLSSNQPNVAAGPRR